MKKPLRLATLKLATIEIDPDFCLRTKEIDPATNRPVFPDMKALIKSIAKEGLLSPPLVWFSPKTSSYKLLAGFRRVEAMKELGWTESLCLICESADEVLMRLSSLSESLTVVPITTYAEVAWLAKMRTKLDPLHFAHIKLGMARMAGKSENFPNWMLAMWDHLHPRIIEAWKWGHPQCHMDFLFLVSKMAQEDQLEEWQMLTGERKRPRKVKPKADGPRCEDICEPEKGEPEKMWVEKHHE
jgi:hypothetical protein